MNERDNSLFNTSDNGDNEELDRRIRDAVQILAFIDPADAAEMTDRAWVDFQERVRKSELGDGQAGETTE